MSWVNFLDLIADDISDSSSSSLRTALLDYIYPIGSVYSSYTSTSPATRFGGTWTAITGRFPYYNAGTGTGGSNTHTLTIAQLPKDYATINIRQMGSSGTVISGNNVTIANTSDSNYSSLSYSGTENSAQNIKFTGSGSAHNNMPAYQTLYAWRRTA